MNHQGELENKKYRNWVRGGLAYKYLKEGIEGFADEVVKQDHNRIVSAGLTCNQCCLRNLQPIHQCKKDNAGRKQCPLSQSKCNCLYKNKQPCPNQICDRIIEDILKSHGSTPPTPNWKNTDMQKWCSAPWEIAKCFINAPGYSDKTKAADIDTPGLLHVFINNINLQSHFSKRLNGSDIFKKTLQRRNELFHSPTMEIEDTKLNECIDEIIAILEDEKELKARHDSEQAVLKLKQLKQKSFIITTHNEVEVCRDALASITNKSEELKQTIQDAKDDIDMKQTEAKKAIGDNANECRDAVVSITNQSAAELKQTIQDAKDDIGMKQTEAKEAIGDKVNKCRDAVVSITNQSAAELKQTIQDAKDDISKKQIEATEATESNVKECRDAVASVTNKSAELKQTSQEAKAYIGKEQAEAIEAIKDKTQKALQQIDKHSETLYERVGRLEIDSSFSKQRLTVLEGKIDVMDRIRQNRQRQLEYVKGKQVLQTKLVELYQTHYVNTSISPLKLEQNDINIKDVYVAPEMILEVKSDRRATNSVESDPNKTNIRTLTGYREILQTNGQKHKQVYIVGDVGTGKSTFCKMMIQNWCSAVSCRRDAAISENTDIDMDSVNVSNKAESSVSDKDESHVSDKDERSICNKDESSASDNDESSICNEDERPVSNKDESSVSNNDESSVSGKDESSVNDKDESSVNDKDESSVSNKNVCSASNKDESKNISSLWDKDESSASDKGESSGSDSAEDSETYDSSDLCDFWTEFEFGYQTYFDQDRLSDVINGNINEMRNYDFLFFVPLQRMSGLSDITEMIKAILTTAGIASKDFIDRIFEQQSERCLIVADGLDEWTPPKGTSVLQHVSYGLPNRDRAKHATFVTLTRPSAKGILKMRSSEYDQKVKLLGINVESILYFIKTYLSKLNETGLSYRVFMKKLNSAKLDHIEKTPLLLQQLVWLYGTGREVGRSISDAYSHLLNIMLGWSQNKGEGDDIEVDQICNTKQEKDMTLPRLLRRFPKCEENKGLLLPLARVAFEALTSEIGSSTFGRSHLRQKGVPKEAIAALIKFGILVENSCYDPTLESTQMEFIHISYLEFLAAVYVSSHFNEQNPSIFPNTVLQDLFQKCKTATDVLQLSNVLKMICGLSPFLISELSKLVSDLVNGMKV